MLHLLSNKLDGPGFSHYSSAYEKVRGSSLLLLYNHRGLKEFLPNCMHLERSPALCFHSSEESCHSSLLFASSLSKKGRPVVLLHQPIKNKSTPEKEENSVIFYNIVIRLTKFKCSSNRYANNGEVQ